MYYQNPNHKYEVINSGIGSSVIYAFDNGSFKKETADPTLGKISLLSFVNWYDDVSEEEQLEELFTFVENML